MSVMSIRDNILATLAYYDVLDWPLTAKEINKYLVRLGRFDILEPDIISQEDVDRTLSSLIQEGTVTYRYGYYVLFDRCYLIPLRRRRQEYAEHKQLLTKRVVKWLKYVSSIEAIFASGSLSLGNTNELSDLDVLIIARSGRIWTARFWVKAVSALLGVRRLENQIIAPDKICPNHFITDKSLHVPFHSMYTAQLYANLMPMYVKNDIILEEFIRENNWIEEYMYNWVIHRSQITDHRSYIIGQTNNTKLEDWFERQVKQYQVKRIEMGLNGLQKGRITYNDEQLEFHPSSPEGRIIPEYNKRLEKLGLGYQEQDSGLLE